jgi:hypothetical protein
MEFAMNQQQIVNMLKSYSRALLATAVTAILTVGAGRFPAEFNDADWRAVFNAVWAAVIPVLIRWADKNDGAFGRGADS